MLGTGSFKDKHGYILTKAFAKDFFIFELIEDPLLQNKKIKKIFKRIWAPTILLVNRYQLN